MAEKEPGARRRVETPTVATPAVAESVKKTPKVETNRPRVPMIRKLIEVDGNLRSFNEFRRAEKNLASSHDVFNAKKKLRQIYGDDLQYKKIMAGLNKSGFNGWGRGIIQLEGCKGYLTVNKGKVKLYLPPIREDIKDKYDKVGQSRLSRSFYMHNLRSNSGLNRFLRWWSLDSTADAKTVRMYDKEDRMRNASLGKDLSSIVAGKAGSYNTMSREDLLSGRFGVTSPEDSPRRAVEVRKWRSLGQYALDKWQGNDRFTLDPNITYMASGSGAMKAAEKVAVVPDVAKKPEAKKKELTPPADTMKAKWGKEGYAVDTVTDPVLNDHLNRVAEQHAPGVLATARHISVVARENAIGEDVVYYSMVDERGNRQWNLATPVGQQPTTSTQNAYRSTVQKFRQPGVTGISSSVEYADSARPADTFILSNADAKGNLVQIIGIDANEKHPTNRVLVLGRESVVKKVKVAARDGDIAVKSRDTAVFDPGEVAISKAIIGKFENKRLQAYFRSGYLVSIKPISDDEKSQLDALVLTKYQGKDEYLQDSDVVIGVPYDGGLYYLAKIGPRQDNGHYNWVLLHPKDKKSPMTSKSIVDAAVKGEMQGIERGKSRLIALASEADVKKNRELIRKKKAKIEVVAHTPPDSKLNSPADVPTPASTPEASNDALDRLDGYFATDAAPDNAAGTAAAPKAEGVVSVAVDDRALLGNVDFNEVAAQDGDIPFDAAPVPVVKPLLPERISATVDVFAGESSAGQQPNEINVAIDKELANYFGGEVRDIPRPRESEKNQIYVADTMDVLIRVEYMSFIASATPLIVTMSLPSGNRAALISAGSANSPRMVIGKNDLVYERRDEIAEILRNESLLEAVRLSNINPSDNKPLAHINIRHDKTTGYVIEVLSQGVVDDYLIASSASSPEVEIANVAAAAADGAYGQESTS